MFRRRTGLRDCVSCRFKTTAQRVVVPLSDTFAEHPVTLLCHWSSGRFWSVVSWFDSVARPHASASAYGTLLTLP